jgi:hypothetical protein
MCAINPFSMAHQWRNQVCAVIDWRLSKNQWRIGCFHWFFLMARQWRNGALKPTRTGPPVWKGGRS